MTSDHATQGNRAVLLKMPGHLQDFKCIGPECEDHCCYGWDIIVDKRSYRRYGKMPPTKLARRIRKAIRRNRQRPSDERYARFMRTGGTCPFLTRDRLCRIHAELGQGFLPDACAVFPRRLRARGEWIEISASLACPETARLALENPHGIEIIQARHDPAAGGMLRAVEHRLPHDIEAAGLTLRAFALSILRDRSHPLWQRILALGFLLEMVSLSDAAPGKETIPILLNQFTRRMDSGELMGLIENAPTLTGLQLQLTRRLHDEIAPSTRVKAFRDCADECLAGLQYAGTQPFTEDIGRRYDSIFDQYYRPFFERNGFLLENYLVSYMLHHDLGFHQGRRLYDDYVVMVLNFSMLKTYLIGMAALYRGRMNAAMVTRLVYSLTKVVEPDARFRDYAVGLLAQSGCTDMAHLAVLIKN